MKTFLLLVLTVGALFLWQRNGDQPATAPSVPAATAIDAPTPATVSSHDWAKSSLDRTHAVIDQVRQSRAENDRP